MNEFHLSSYEDSIAFLTGRIDYERASADVLTARDFKLDRMRELLARLGNPHETIPAVHIAGTKGKGSTAVMTAEILTAAGYRTGLFTSPHISVFEERMRVDGRVPDRQTFLELINDIVSVVAQMDLLGPELQPTYFEIATAMAWLYFRRQRCDFVVLEVGMGGRLDSTNLCRPDVTVITNISRDHVHVLGDSESQIAREKAGIIKPHVPVISGVTHPEARAVIRSIAEFNEADFYEFGADIRSHYHRHRRPVVVDVQSPHGVLKALPLKLAGSHQAVNASLAVSVADVLRHRGYCIPNSAIATGLSNVRWPLRFEVVATQPMFVVDAAHNTASAGAVVETLAEEFPDRQKTLIFSTSRDKEVEQIAGVLFPHFDAVILTQFLGNPRSFSPAELFERIGHLASGRVLTAGEPAGAVCMARDNVAAEGLICATGSFYLAAEVRSVVLQPGVESPLRERVVQP